VKVELPLSQEELASWCGASRESTVKALRTLREVGAVTTGRRQVTLHDVDGLRRHARLR
jgi:CRP/FNR family transcriptional regulator, cyclic AMP receptor protein